MKRLVRVKNAVPLEGFRVRLKFTDDTEREVDFEPYLRGPIFQSLRRDPALFRALRVDSRMGTVVWPNGADIDPDVLYHGLTPSWAEDEHAGVEKL